MSLDELCQVYFVPTGKKCKSSSRSTNEELIAQEKELIRRHKEWEVNKNVRATQAAPNNAPQRGIYDAKRTAWTLRV
jgi:hypothetical protein